MLSDYSDAAWNAAKDVPDEELATAQAKLNAARAIVSKGRLAFALGRCLPEHIKYWPSWSLREDFHSLVGFDAKNIRTYKQTADETSREVEIATIDLFFHDSFYRFILRDRGMLYDPHSSLRFGDIELWHFDVLVAHFDLVEDISKDFSYWEYSDVRALRVGPWMKDVLDMANQIEVSQRRRQDDYVNSRTREAGKNIDLGT